MKKYWYVLCSVLILGISFSYDSSVYQFRLPLTSGVSLMRIGVDPHPLVEEGKEIAALVWDAINNNNITSAEKAIQSYDSLIQKKRRIVEFSALKWLCECIIASEEEKNSLKDLCHRNQGKVQRDQAHLGLPERIRNACTGQDHRL